MTDLAETLWREFAVETEEHFEIIEPLLVAAETEAIVAADIAQLFRSFHSVKGLSRSMDMRGMEEVAHHAENLLGLVRDGSSPLDLDAVALLLEAIDALKHLREAAVGQRSNTPTPEDLIVRLRAAYEARVGTAAKPAEAAKAVPDQDGGAAAHDLAHDLGTDRDMLRIYAEMVEQHLPVIARMATAEIAVASLRQEAGAAIDALLHATEVMGFEGLAVSLRALGELAAQEPTEDAKFRAADALGQIRSEIELIEREVPAKIAGSALADRLRDALQAELHAIVDGTLDVLNRFSDGQARSSETDEGLADELAMLARSACTFFLFLDLHQASRLVLMVEDVFTRVANREMYLYPELLELTREVAGLLTDVAEGMGRWSDLEESVIDDILERFRRALLVGTKDQDGGDPISALKRVLNDYDISAELVEILSAENIQDLIAAVKNGRGNLYEILAHLEGSEQMTLNFVKWAKSEATPITNRTVFIDGRTWFEFLVVSHLDSAQVAARIAEIDPSGANVQVKSCRSKTPSPSAAVANPARRMPPDAKAAAPAPAKGGNVLRVRGETVDHLMAQVGELVTISNMLHATVKTDEVDAALSKLKETAWRMADGTALQHWIDVVEKALRAVATTDDHLASAVGRLQDATLELRVVPIDTLFNRFPRVIRDIAQATGKQVRLEAEGAEVRIDKGMVDQLLDPLMHMVRNAVDHGIEPSDERERRGKPSVARVRLAAVSRGNRVEIEISDDGRGLDVERIRRKAVERGLIGAAEAAHLSADEVVDFIFAPGFSTAEQITETSGRGVGMDVVHTNILRLGGSVVVTTRPGEGTTFTLQLPLSAAIQRVLMVEAAGQILAIPERFLTEIHEAAAEHIQMVRGRPAILLREAFLPLFRLTELLGLAASAPHAGARRPVVVLANGRHRIGIEVDRLHRRQELFVKEIHPDLASIPGVGGASIAGDGRVVLIVDGDDLFHLAEASSALPSATIH